MGVRAAQGVRLCAVRVEDGESDAVEEGEERAVEEGAEGGDAGVGEEGGRGAKVPVGAEEAEVGGMLHVGVAPHRLVRGCYSGGIPH